MTENTTITNTHYLAGGFQYKDSNLQFFPHAEGYVKYENADYSYVFNYTDHLGNVRVSYSDIDKNGILGDEHMQECFTQIGRDGSPQTFCNDYYTSAILEENHYYPFGLKHSGYNANNSQPNYNYKYNGKELQTELGLNMYDYGARNYDPAIGRWMNVDPLAEKFVSSTPYSYALNNPVIFIDPDGKEVVWGEGLSDEQKMEIGHFVNQLRRKSKTFNDIFEKLHSSKNVFTIDGSDFSQMQSDAEVLPNAPVKILDVINTKTFELTTEPGTPGAHLTFYFGNMKQDNVTVSEILTEEFVHLYQNLFYVGENSFDYEKKPDGVNIEFEAKLISGIIKNEANFNLLDSRKEPGLIAHGFAERLGVEYRNGRKMSNYSGDMRQWINQPSLSNLYKIKDVDFNRLPSLLINILSN
ncbi:RHS repeat domain-containing protein [Flavobacterium jejuense]|uniref:RHS repeat domain-containing protein n=1 Tax=Flavobacterium jejuense TaxID=1544455 RepID=UPI00293C0D5C|nr:RHS repeat-associated core domain-containing protein [Flavobacterium jejuense]